MRKSILILAAAIVLAAIIFGGFYYAAEINKQQLINEQIQLENERQVSIVNLQKDCATAANEFFMYMIKDWPELSSDYEIHFNSKLNKCFIFISWENEKSRMYSFYYYDVYERSRYAEVSIIGNNSNNPIRCVVDNSGCSSMKEFNNLTDPLMED